MHQELARLLIAMWCFSGFTPIGGGALIGCCILMEDSGDILMEDSGCIEPEDC